MILGKIDLLIMINLYIKIDDINTSAINSGNSNGKK